MTEVYASEIQEKMHQIGWGTKYAEACDVKRGWCDYMGQHLPYIYDSRGKGKRYVINAAGYDIYVGIQ